MASIARTVRRAAGLGTVVLALVAAAPAAAVPRAGAPAGAPVLAFTSATQTFTVSLGSGVKHEATATLVNKGTSATGAMMLRLLPKGGHFTIARDTCPSSLGPGKSCTVTVRFAPDAAVPASAAVLTATSRKGSAAAMLITGSARKADAIWNFCDADPDNVYSENCIYGTEGDDYVYGTILQDYVWGYGGNDNLHGAGDSDVIYGGDGDDLIHGGVYPDELYGDAGNDTIEGNEGADEIRVGTGNNVASGGDGPDHIYGDAGNDSLSGNDGDDYLDGGMGSDLVSGGGGDDTMDNPGDGVRDTFDGGNGYDRCYSGDPAGVDVFINCEFTWTAS